MKMKTPEEVLADLTKIGALTATPSPAKPALATAPDTRAVDEAKAKVLRMIAYHQNAIDDLNLTLRELDSGVLTTPARRVDPPAAADSPSLAYEASNAYVDDPYQENRLQKSTDDIIITIDDGEGPLEVPM